MKGLATLAALVALTRSLSAEPLVLESGDTRATLLELFTSEGCSSCPPADAWIGKLKASPELWRSIVPVVFHVDYWNGLGWPDRFATRAFTDRQRRYSAAWRREAVYTPGFVLNGGEWREWYRSETPAAPFAGKTGKLRVTLHPEGRVEVLYRPGGDQKIPRQVELALLGGNVVSEVKRGENGGRTLRHEFVALYLGTAPFVSAERELAASLTLPGKYASVPVAVAAWVTGGEAQPPIQAVGGWVK